MEELMANSSSVAVETVAVSNNGSSSNNEDICRDFLRNVCTRGSRCKYFHPVTEEVRPTQAVIQQNGGLTFCHDFQNTQCNRASCKFVHATRQDEEHYKNTGELPRSIIVKNNEGEVPVCKDYLKGDCHRGKKCKFRHLPIDNGKSEYRERFEREDFEGPEPKRRHIEEPEPVSRYPYRHFEYAPHYRERQSYSPPGSQWSFSQGSGGNVCNQLELRMLNEENLILRRKIEDLKKQVSDLMATNEFLLEQNAHLRLGKLPAATSVATVTIPAVTIASSMSVSAPTSVSATLPLGAPAQVTPSLSASLPLAGTMSLAQPTQLATVSIAPVSLTQPSAALAAPAGTVTLAPTINAAGTVTLAPTINAAGIHLAPNTALSLSDPSAGSLVSYPIMTQSLIPPAALQTSLTR